MTTGIFNYCYYFTAVLHSSCVHITLAFPQMAHHYHILANRFYHEIDCTISVYECLCVFTLAAAKQVRSGILKAKPHIKLSTCGKTMTTLKILFTCKTYWMIFLSSQMRNDHYIESTAAVAHILILPQGKMTLDGLFTTNSKCYSLGQ